MSEELRETFYPESRFGGFTDVDGTVTFYRRVRALLPEGATVVDAGCGAGTHAEDEVRVRRDLRDLRDRAGEVIGLDVDDAASVNPTVTEFRFLEEPYEWPVEDGAVDLVLSDFVLEHVEEPSAYLGEAARVLAPGGHLCLRTPNLFSYFGLVSHLVPNAWHAKVAGRVQGGERGEEEVFPTRYRCNTRWRLARTLDRLGFDAHVYGYEAEPSYLSFSRIAYFLGVLHQCFAPGFLRVALFAFGEKR